MKATICSLGVAGLALWISPVAMADVNDLSGGAMITHYEAAIAFSSDPPAEGWCGAYSAHAISHSAQEVVRIDGPGEYVWYVLAAWDEPKVWSGTEFGFGSYPGDIFSIYSYGPCYPVTGIELPTPGWPGPNEGTAIVVLETNYWTGNWKQVYYFTGYAYANVGIIPIDVDPITDFVGFTNCDQNPQLFPVLPNSGTSIFRGGMGFNTEGYRAAPAGLLSVCCVGTACFILTQSECADLSGEWHSEWEDCDPDPCDNTMVTLWLLDHESAPIPGSQFYVDGALVAQGGSIELAPGSHAITLYPGLRDSLQTSYLYRTDDLMVGMDSAQVESYVWKRSYLAVDLVDQTQMRIQYSQWRPEGSEPSALAAGDSAYLPVTEDPETPDLGGEFAHGYRVNLYPGINGHSQMLQLSRLEQSELPATGTAAVHTWKSGLGTLHVVDSTEAELPSSSFSLSYGLGTGPTGTGVHLPVTEDAGMSAPGGHFAAGYAIDVRPSEAHPFTSFTFELDSTYTFAPEFVVASGVECGLRLNLPAACCLETGVCAITSQSGCDDLGGTWYGDQPLCDPNPCPVPTVPQIGAGTWIAPEPWHNWVGNEGEAGVPIQVQIPEQYGEIEHVEFYVSFDQGATWELIADDQDGYEPALGPDSTVAMTGCGWSTSYAVPESTSAGPIQFKSVAYPDSGTVYEVVRECNYDPLPPSLGTVSLEDFQVIDREGLGFDVDPHGMVVSRIIVHRAPMEEVFTKGIPGISQQSHSQYHCAPTAAAQCLKYFESGGDTLVGGGLAPDGLVDALAAYMSTGSSTGTLPSNWVSGMGQWLEAYGDGYTVRYYCHYNCEGGGSTWTEADWRRVRNELELCRDVLLGVFWDGGGAHALTLNSIVYPALPSGRIVVGFKDPWTGEDASGELDPETGYLANMTGGRGRSSGQIGVTMLVSPTEHEVYAGGPGEPVYDGLPSGGPPYHIEIPVPEVGLWFVHVTLVNESGHAHRMTNIIEREVPAPAACCLETGVCAITSQSGCDDLGGTWYGDQPLCDPNPCPVPTVPQIGAGTWIAPEPWHNWVGNEGEAGVPIQVQIPEQYGEIEHVEFYVSFDQGATWELIADDQDGYEPALGPDSTVAMTGCGWSTSYAVPESTSAGPIQFKSVAYPDSGTVYEVVRECNYDPLPPSLGTVSLEDFQVIDREGLGFDVDPHGMVVSRIIVHRAPMEEVFTKGIPGISQQSHSQYHCAPTAAAQCLKYFESGGDTLVGGGLAPDGLVDALAAYMSTGSSTGTLPSNWVSGMGQWLEAYGDGYTVRYYCHYNCEGGGSTWTEADWRRVRNELELCRDVLLGVFWDGGGAHALTLNSIVYPALPSGRIVVGFKDPWTGEDASGELDPETGYLANMTGGRGRSSGQIGVTMLVSPTEHEVYAGGPGEPVYDGLPSGGPPYHIEIPVPEVGLWFVHVTLVNESGHAHRMTNIIERLDTSSVGTADGVPLTFALQAGAPNPFHARTTIAYAVPQPTELSLKIYDVTGRTVRTLVAGAVAAGRYEIEWDGSDGAGHGVGSGIYYVRMRTPGFESTRRITVLR